MRRGNRSAPSHYCAGEIGRSGASGWGLSRGTRAQIRSGSSVFLSQTMTGMPDGSVLAFVFGPFPGGGGHMTLTTCMLYDWRATERVCWPSVLRTLKSGVRWDFRRLCPRALRVMQGAAGGQR